MDTESAAVGSLAPHGASSRNTRGPIYTAFTQRIVTSGAGWALKAR